jgi:hypothetical protein
MPHVLRMAAFQVSHPVVLVILMIANDSSLHHVPLLGGDSPIDRKDTASDPC